MKMSESSKTHKSDPLANASGLDESQIDARDLQALRDACKVRSLALEMRSAISRLASSQRHAKEQPHAPRRAELGLPRAKPLRLRIAQLPAQAVCRQFDLSPARPRVRRNLNLARRVPVGRRRFHPDELPGVQLKALFRALYQHFGEEARQLEVLAIFPHIPPEAKGSVSVSSDLKWAHFVLPRRFPAHKALPGRYLVVLRDAGNETREVLIRL